MDAEFSQLPRATNGTYSLPSGTTVSPGDTLLVSQHNPAMADIEQALTNSLSRDGQGGMRADLDAGGFKVTNLAPGVADDDAATVGQVAAGNYTPPDSVTSDIATVKTMLDALADGEVDYAPAEGGTDDGVKMANYASRGSGFFGGTETDGPQNDERGYWNYWIQQLGRAPGPADTGIYSRTLAGRNNLAPGNYGTALGGHCVVVFNVGGTGAGVGNAVGSAVACEFSGTISGTTLTITEMNYGAITVGRPLYGLKTTGSSFISSGVTVTAQGTGTGYEGTYTISASQSVGAVANVTAGNPVITITSGTLLVGQKVTGAGLQRDTTVTAVGGGTATLSANPVANGTGVTIAVVMACGDHDDATADFIGYSAWANGKNSHAVGQQSNAEGEQCEAWARGSVAKGRLARARGCIGNVAIGDVVETSKSRDYWSGVWGQYLSVPANGGVAEGTGPNPASPMQQVIDQAYGIGMNALLTTFNVLPGSPGDGNVGSAMCRGPIALWKAINTTWKEAVRFSGNVTNTGSGGYVAPVIEALSAGVMVTLMTFDPVQKYPIFQGDRVLMGTNRTIPTSSSTGVAGERCWDANFIYQCIATNTWARIAWTSTSW